MKRYEQWRFTCPYCGGVFFTIHVSMTRRYNRLPTLTSLRADITCDHCGLMTAYGDFVSAQRGWLIDRKMPRIRRWLAVAGKHIKEV